MKKEIILNPNCSTTITRMELTEEEKLWVQGKIKEYNLDKEVIECFITKAEKVSGADNSKWMNEQFDETWRDFTMLQTMINVKRNEINIGPAKVPLSEKEGLEKEIEDEEMIITALMGSEEPYANEKIWKDLYKHLGKYFKLKKEAKDEKTT